MGIAIRRAYLLNTNDSKVSGYQYLSISPFTYILEYSTSYPRGSRDSSCEIRSIKTGTCLHLNQGLAQKRNFNPKSKQEKYQRKFKTRVDHGKIHSKWPRAPPLSQLENLVTLCDTVHRNRRKTVEKMNKSK